MHILLISGPIAAGKSSVADLLVSAHGFRSIRSSRYLRDVARSRGLADPDRAYLQELGDEFDHRTAFRWLLQNVVEPEVSAVDGYNWLIDCVRKQGQVDVLRERYGNAVTHAHLYASEPILRARFLKRAADHGINNAEEAYRRDVMHPNEVSARSLGQLADISIDLSDMPPAEAARTVLTSIRGVTA